MDDHGLRTILVHPFPGALARMAPVDADGDRRVHT